MAKSKPKATKAAGKKTPVFPKEKTAEKILGDVLYETPVPPRPEGDPFPASAFPSEEAMFQSLGVPAHLAGGREGYEVIDQSAGNYFYNTKTGQPEPISKPSAPFPTEANTDKKSSPTEGNDSSSEASSEPASQTAPPLVASDRSELTGGRAFPAQFPTESQNEGRTDRQNAVATEATTQATDEDRAKLTGEIADSAATETVDNRMETLLSSRAERLPGESRNGCWERLRKMARAAGMPRGQGPGTAYFWADEQISRIFSKETEPVSEETAEEASLPTVGTLDPPSIPVVSAPIPDDQGVSGLSDLPPGWPELPANAQLQVEIAWVTANRLRVRDGTGVNLSKALSPAPSYSALSWLETSILFPAKFADISVKATADQDSEKEFVKREKMAIAEIRSILAEMLEAKD